MAEEYDPAFPTDDPDPGDDENTSSGSQDANKKGEDEVKTSPQHPDPAVLGAEKPAHKQLSDLQGSMSGLVNYQSSPSAHGDSGDSDDENESKKGAKIDAMNTDQKSDSQSADVSVEEVKTSLSKISVENAAVSESANPEILRTQMEAFENSVHLTEGKSNPQSSSLNSKDSVTDMDTSPAISIPLVKEDVPMETNSGTSDKSVSSSGNLDKEAVINDSSQTSTSSKDVDILSVSQKMQESTEIKSKEFSESSQKFTPRTVRMSNSRAKTSKKPPTPDTVPKKPPVVEWRIGFVRRDDYDEESDSSVKDSKSTPKDELAKPLNILPNLPKKDPMSGLTTEVKERLARAIANVGEGKRQNSPKDDSSQKEDEVCSPSSAKPSSPGKCNQSTSVSTSECHKDQIDASGDKADVQDDAKRTKHSNYESDEDTEKHEVNSNNNGNHSVAETSRSTRRSRRRGGGDPEVERNNSPPEDSRRSTRRSSRLRGGKKDESPERNLPSRSRSRRRGSNKDNEDIEKEEVEQRRKEEVEQKRSESPAIPVEQAPSRRSSRRRGSKRGDNETESKETGGRQEEVEKPRSDSPPTTRRGRRRGRDSKEETTEKESSRRPITPSVPDESEQPRRSSRRRGSNRNAKDHDDRPEDVLQDKNKETEIISERTSSSEKDPVHSADKEKEHAITDDMKEHRDTVPARSNRRKSRSPETLQTSHEKPQQVQSVLDVKPTDHSEEVHQEFSITEHNNPTREEQSVRYEEQHQPAADSYANTNPMIVDSHEGSPMGNPIHVSVQNTEIQRIQTIDSVHPIQPILSTTQHVMPIVSTVPSVPPMDSSTHLVDSTMYASHEEPMDMDIGSPVHDEVPIETYHIPVIGSNPPVSSLSHVPPPVSEPIESVQMVPQPVPPPPPQMEGLHISAAQNICPVPSIVSTAIPSLVMSSPSPVPTPSPISVISSPAAIPVIGGRSPMIDTNSRSPAHFGRGNSNLVSIPTYDNVPMYDEPQHRAPLLDTPPPQHRVPLLDTPPQHRSPLLDTPPQHRTPLLDTPPPPPTHFEPLELPPMSEALPIPVIGNKKRKARWGSIETGSTLIPLSPLKQDILELQEPKVVPLPGGVPLPSHLQFEAEHSQHSHSSDDGLPVLPLEEAETTSCKSTLHDTPHDDEPPPLTEHLPVPRPASLDFTSNPPPPPPPLEAAPTLVKEEIKKPPKPTRSVHLTIAPRKQKVMAPRYSLFAEDVDVEWNNDWVSKHRKRTSSTESDKSSNERAKTEFVKDKIKSEIVDSTTTKKEEFVSKDIVESKEECPVLVKEETPAIKMEDVKSAEDMPIIKEELSLKEEKMDESVKEEPSKDNQQDVSMDSPSKKERPSAVETIMALVAEATSTGEIKRTDVNAEPRNPFDEQREMDKVAPSKTENSKGEVQIPGLGSPFHGLEEGEIDVPSPTEDKGEAMSTDGAAVKSGDMEEGELIEEKADPSTWGIVERDKLPKFEDLEENYYLTERRRSKASKEARRMVCECTTSKRERAMGYPACGEDCLNRVLMIECSYRCPCGDHCTNRRFQKKQNSDVGVFHAADKGHGLKAKADLKANQFIMEYVGEVLNYSEFKQRTKQYNKENNSHFFFMALKQDEVIDATKKGNLSRFINHSCDPNCETQKWTVNGQLRVGFFTKQNVKAGTELTFDYQFEDYGKSAQKCLCGTEKCRGFIGKPKKQKTETPKRSKGISKRRESYYEDVSLEEEVERFSSTLEGHGLKTSDDTLMLCRLMVRSDSRRQRLQLLQVLQETQELTCLKNFLSHHGLKLLWSWMVDLGDKPLELQTQILMSLMRLPIPHKNALDDSKVYSVVEKWAKEIAKPSEDPDDSSANDTPSQTPSQTPSRSATPLSLQLTPVARNSPVDAIKGESTNSESDNEKGPKKLFARTSDTKVAAADSQGESGSSTPVVATEGDSMDGITQLSDATAKDLDKTTEQDKDSESKDKENADDDSAKKEAMEDEGKTVSTTTTEDGAETKSVVKDDEGEAVAKEGEAVAKVGDAENKAEAVAKEDGAEAKAEADSKTEADAKDAAEAKAKTGDEDEAKAKMGDEGADDKPMEVETSTETSEKTTSTEKTDKVKSDDEVKIVEEVKPADTTDSQDEGADTESQEEMSVKGGQTAGIAGIAASLLEAWGNLKEIYRIPKREDRLSNERDRDRDRYHDRDRRDYDRDYDRDHRDRDRDRHKRRYSDRDRDRDYDRSGRDRFGRDRDRRRERSRSRDRDRYYDRDRDHDRDRDRGRSDKRKRSRSRSKDRDSKDTDTSSRRKSWKGKDSTTPESAKKVPKMSKEQRRSLFEQKMEQKIKEDEEKKKEEAARKEEEAKMLEEQQQQQQQQQQVFLDANGFPMLPPGGFPMDPNNPGMPMDPNMMPMPGQPFPGPDGMPGQFPPGPDGMPFPGPDGMLPPPMHPMDPNQPPMMMDPNNPHMMPPPQQLLVDENGILLPPHMQPPPHHPGGFEMDPSMGQAPPAMQPQPQIPPLMPPEEHQFVQPQNPAPMQQEPVGVPEQMPEQQQVWDPSQQHQMQPTSQAQYQQQPPIQTIPQTQPAPYVVPQPAPAPVIQQQPVVQAPAVASVAQQPVQQPQLIQAPVVAQQQAQPAPTPSAAQTVTFVTPDGMLVTQTITPLQAQPEAQPQPQPQPQVAQPVAQQSLPQVRAPIQVQHLQQQLQLNQQLATLAPGATQAVQQTAPAATVIQDTIPSPPAPNPPAREAPPPLPPNWKTAKDSDGKIYYYHTITRQTQWDPPTADGAPPAAPSEYEMDIGTPTYDEKTKRKTTTAAADTSSEVAKRTKEHFRSKMSHYVIACLNPYRKPDCKVGRIVKSEDFKHLARKLTHGIMAKELKHCRNIEDLEVNENVKHKAKEYIKKYMGRYGKYYKKDSSDT